MKQARAAPFVNGEAETLREGVGCVPIAPFRYRKNEIYPGVAWQVEILNETVAAEIAALPADMQARFLRLAERIASAGLQSLGEPHVKHWRENYGNCG